MNTYGYVSGNPVGFSDPSGLRPLSDCERKLLYPYFSDEDLDNVNIIDDHVPWWLPKSFPAVTLGNDVYIRPNYYDSTVIQSPTNNSGKVTANSGVALLAHEMVHVEQYRLGMSVLEYLLGGRHDKNPKEREADSVREDIVEDWYQFGAGACECTK